MLDGFDYRAHPSSYFGMLHLPANWSAGDLVSAAARRGVRLRAAEAFTTDQPAPSAIRLCVCGIADAARLAEGLGRVVALLREGDPELRRHDAAPSERGIAGDTDPHGKSRRWNFNECS